MFYTSWTVEKVESFILSKSDSEPLNSLYYSKNYPDVYAAACRLFGSWRNTLETCGFDYDKIRKYKVWTKQMVIDEIQKLFKQGYSISSQEIQDNRKPLYMAAIHRFNSWGNAVQAAGINYSGIRCRRSMSPLEIKEEIIRLYKKGVDMSYCNARTNFQYLLAAGMKKIGGGSWAIARRVCGIDTNYRVHPSKRKILKLRKMN